MFLADNKHEAYRSVGSYACRQPQKTTAAPKVLLLTIRSIGIWQNPSALSVDSLQHMNIFISVDQIISFDKAHMFPKTISDIVPFESD